MKKLTCLWATALALLAAPVSATTLSFAASPAQVQVGDSFTLDVLVSGVPDLYAFQFDVAFDSTLLQADSVVEGDFLSAGGRSTFFVPGAIDNVAGTVSFTANTLVGAGPVVAGDGLLVHLTLHAVAPGQAGLALWNVVVLDSSLAELATSSVDGLVNVTSVPEPASLALFGLGLAAVMAGTARRNRR